MNALKGIYQNGTIELLEKPRFETPVEVLVIFPEKRKAVKKIGGLFKGFPIDYERIGRDLKELSRRSEEHLLSELGDDK